ncbi:Acyl-CoA dehydrogenase [Cupriavidus oxalaticus]|uniref:acyl-CoA dehydrogenase n=1 Tax=Cupriavidus oxalaticus TaxID=96344 RepID=UPI003F7405C3
MTETTQASRDELDELLAAIEDSAEKFLDDRGGLAVPRRQRATEHDVLPKPEFGRADWQQITELGWPAILVPASLDGLDLGLGAAAVVARKVGRWLAPEPFTAVAGVAAALLANAQTEAAQALLTSILSGERIVGVALDLDENCDSGPVHCRIELGSDGARRLSGTVRYVVPAAPADGWLIVARDEQHQPVLLHVHSGLEKLVVVPELEADGRCRARLTFSGAAVQERAIMAEGEGVQALLGHAMQVGRILCAAELIGAAERLQELTLEHLTQRRQFGRAIGSFQVLQHRCVDVRTQIELAKACLDEAVSSPTNGGNVNTLEVSAVRAKLRACQAAMESALAAVHLHGAMGITDECDVGLYFKRILALMPRFGTERVLQKRWLELAGAATEDNAAVGEWEGEFPRIADWEAMPEEQFRAMVRAFLVHHYPDHLRHMPRRVHWDEIEDWYHCLSRQGWIAPAWPVAHGGMGLPAAKLIAWFEEFESYGVARAPDQGILMVGPILMHYGTPEQQRQFLPRILSGENIWCQGYSEPNAGSDLASLRTEAIMEGDHFVVNGQKIWTTLAQDATHIFMLVRTDKAAKPQAGISFLLCELNSPGITVRPIRDLAGNSEFCEVFFDGVRVPHENLVGNLNEGWTIAKALLGFERLHLGSPKQSQHALGHLRTLAQRNALMEDPAFRAAYAELALDVADLGALYAKYADYVKRGERLPPSVSMLKIWATETYQRIGLAITRYAGDAAALAGAVDVGGSSVHLLAPLLNASAAKIYGGANEVQRNILARTVLELPG